MTVTTSKRQVTSVRRCAARHASACVHDLLLFPAVDGELRRPEGGRGPRLHLDEEQPIVGGADQVDFPDWRGEVLGEDAHAVPPQEGAGLRLAFAAEFLPGDRHQRLPCSVASLLATGAKERR